MSEQEEATPEVVEPTVFDADYVKALRAEAAKYRTEARANAERLQAIEDSQKSEAEKTQERLVAAEKEATAARLDALRYRVGVAAGLPPEFISRLQGDDEESMTTDAQQLAALLPKPAPVVSTRPTPLQPGAVAPDEAKPLSVDDWLRGQLRQ